MNNNKQSSNNEISNTDLSEAFKKPIGIYDPDGKNINPLTKKPYENLYSHIIKNIDGKDYPATYANLSKIWRTKLVYKNRDKILDTIKENQVILATAGTGVGKTVIIPKLALHAFDYEKKVICTIPKKIITKSTADFAAMCLDVNLGEHVGYSYRGESMRNKNGVETKLTFTTTGSVIARMTGNDPLLEEFSCIIIDEAHERSIENDQLLLLLKQALLKRKDLKVVIMSATIDLDTYRNYFPKKVYQFGEVDAGHHLSYDVKDMWLLSKPLDWHKMAVNITIRILKTSEEGDILIFGRSSGDAIRICDILNQEVNISNKNSDNKIKPFCVKLAGNSDKEEEKLATDQYKYLELLNTDKKPFNRKVVIATNVAESSLTVDGIVYVIDSGLEFVSGYNSSTMVRSLLEENASQASVKQRKGRAGRTRPGMCFHLYSEEEYNTFKSYVTPDIQKTDLTGVLLNMLMLNYIKNIGELRKMLEEFISPPSKNSINSALRILYSIGAINNMSNTGKLTDIGIALTKFRAISPCMAKTLLTSHYYNCEDSIIDLVALSIIADGKIEDILTPFKPNKNKTTAENKKDETQYKKIISRFISSKGDYFTCLNIYNYYKKELKDKIDIKSSSNYKSNSNNTSSNSNNTSSKSNNTSSKSNIDIIDKFDDLDDLLDEYENKNKKVLSGGSKTSIEKWCKKNNINCRRIMIVNKLVKQIKDTLKMVVRNRRNPYIKNVVELDDEYERIIYSLLSGNYMFIGREIKPGVYETCFPIEKSLGRINEKSTFKKNAKLVLFNEMFISNIKSSYVKLNMVNDLPEKIAQKFSETQPIKILDNVNCFKSIKRAKTIKKLIEKLVLKKYVEKK